MSVKALSHLVRAKSFSKKEQLKAVTYNLQLVKMRFFEVNKTSLLKNHRTPLMYIMNQVPLNVLTSGGFNNTYDSSFVLQCYYSDQSEPKCLETRQVLPCEVTWICNA